MSRNRKSASEDDEFKGLTFPVGFLDELARTASREEVFATYARWASRLMSSNRSTVAIAEDGGLRLYAIEGNQAIRTGALVPIEGTMIGQVYRSRRAEICADFSKAPHYQELAKLAEGGLVACMDAPIVAGDHCFGALAAGYLSGDGFSDREFVLLKALARCLGSYLLLHEQLSQLSELVLTDPLTRTFNRRYFQQSIVSLWDQWQGRGEHFAIALIDLDHFKSVNDTYGHDVGDHVLRLTSDVLKRNTRGGDELIRMGGEEFCLILRNAQAAVAVQIADRVRAAIEAEAFMSGEERIPVTISIGIAATDEKHDDYRAMMMQADRSLYAAKNQGRNCVALAA